MKKIFSFVAVALTSAVMFAAPSVIPTTAQIAANYDATTDVVLAVYFDEEVCQDLVFMGNYNGWALDESTVYAEELDGFPGWYIFKAPAVIEGVDGDGNPTSDLLQAKPVQLKNGDLAGWDYQTGDPASWVNHGDLEMTITDGFSGESNLEYPSAGIYIYESLYFKGHKTPCITIPEHDYTIYLYSPVCGNYKPAIIGAFNGWAEGVPMRETVDDDFNTVYVANIHDEEGHDFKFREVNVEDWSNQIVLFNEEGIAYDNPNVVLGEEEEIILDYSAGTWTLCGDAVETVAADVVATKVIRNGQIVILKGDAEFNLLGAQVK